MSEKIEPALTAEDWMALPHFDKAYQVDVSSMAGEWPRVLAIANAALPDSDPRKITREKINAMREASDVVDGESTSPGQDPTALALDAFADALESYLPPEKQTHDFDIIFSAAAAGDRHAADILPLAARAFLNDAKTDERDGLYLFVSGDGLQWTTRGEAVDIAPDPVRLGGLELSDGFAIADIAAEAERTQRYFALGERKGGVLMIRKVFIPTGARHLTADLLDRG